LRVVSIGNLAVLFAIAVTVNTPIGAADLTSRAAPELQNLPSTTRISFTSTAINRPAQGDRPPQLIWTNNPFRNTFAPRATATVETASSWQRIATLPYSLRRGTSPVAVRVREAEEKAERVNALQMREHRERSERILPATDASVPADVEP
jgi:hypothetical protein